MVFLLFIYSGTGNSTHSCKNPQILLLKKFKYDKLLFFTDILLPSSYTTELKKTHAMLWYAPFKQWIFFYSTCLKKLSNVAVLQ